VPNQLKTLIEARAKAWERMKALNDLEELDATQDEEYRQLEAAIDNEATGFNVKIESITGRQSRFAQRSAQFEGDGNPANPGKTDPESRAAEEPSKELLAFRSFLKGANPSALPELRSLQADSDTEGGYMLAPQTVAAALLKAVDNETFVRNYAHKETILESVSLGVVSLETDLGAADWTQELTQSVVDEALRLGKRELRPVPLTKETKLSRTLVRKTAGRAENLVLGRLGYQFGVTQENAFLNGSGAGQPLGAFTASPLGLSTARDVSTDNTTTAMTADGLIEAKHTLKGQYWARARWLFHRDGIKKIRKLKDGDGQYLWAPGLAGGLPNTIFDSPYDMSEYAPNTFTAGLYVGLLADWEFYWIVDCLQLEIQVLNELYARSNQFGYIGRLECDGMPVLEEAFVRVKLAP
jgi:HK97 family phage major capsid protein